MQLERAEGVEVLKNIGCPQRHHKVPHMLKSRKLADLGSEFLEQLSHIKNQWLDIFLIQHKTIRMFKKMSETH